MRATVLLAVIKDSVFQATSITKAIGANATKDGLVKIVAILSRPSYVGIPKFQSLSIQALSRNLV